MNDESVKISSPRERVTIIEFAGEHDLSTKDEVMDVLDRLVLENDLVVVDLCAATFIDSSFLSCLVNADAHAAEQGHELRLHVCDTPNITSALEVTGLSERLTIVDTLEQALNS